MMRVRKYRSIEEMDAATRRRPGDPELYRAIRFVWSLGRNNRQPRFKPGVYKYESINALWAAQEAATTRRD